MDTLTPAQRDTLAELAQRINVASLAVAALDDSPDHDSIACVLLHVARDLQAFAAASESRRVLARRRIGVGA